jgi:two-component system sensor histidine kinase BaeS
MDSGPGVPAEQLPRLFERFFRGEASRNRKSGGAGLGLSICQRIVEAHEGRIEAKASPLGGLWLRVEIPAA